jgi:hypothetical protein
MGKRQFRSQSLAHVNEFDAPQELIGQHQNSLEREFAIAKVESEQIRSMYAHFFSQNTALAYRSSNDGPNRSITITL